ncbi:50S ribosomal protein L35 [Leptospira idonii]|uniref:Large ribosomal subunit protein bL35 n=1 Tax=Leptospira idonii TaxID=1193500 RepID=A0A4R9LZY3_9LEPT|nr:50S ribosomal protein L35 [Leptospira idonii]TGN17710.1 50S ribosomal protein L35 [Leptospira idonii]
MYKLKTNRAAAKRFKFTKNGKIKRGHAFKRHILEKKSPKMKLQSRGMVVINDSDYNRVEKLLPYGG